MATALNEWVVTYRIEHKDSSGWGVTEFFRGSEKECRRIKEAFASGESDCVPTAQPWAITIGPAADWDLFLMEN